MTTAEVVSRAGHDPGHDRCDRHAVRRTDPVQRRPGALLYRLAERCGTSGSTLVRRADGGERAGAE